MKKIFTCSLLFILAFVVKAQDYLPMLEDNACWGRKYLDNISLPPVVEDRATYYIFSSSTEIINGLEYTSLFNEYDPVLEDTPIGYLREDIASQKVFYLNADEEFSWLNCGGEEILLYDFSAGVGDTVYHCPNSDFYYVVQSVEIFEDYTNSEINFYSFGGGRVYEVFSSEFNFSTIYEGVGSNIGPIHEPYNVSVPGNEILSSYDRDCAFILNTSNLLETKVEIIPNPVQNVLNIRQEEESGLSQVKIYNVSGQNQMTFRYYEMNSSINVEKLTKGLYFIAGYDEKARRIFTQKFVKQN